MMDNITTDEEGYDGVYVTLDDGDRFFVRNNETIIQSIMRYKKQSQLKIKKTTSLPYSMIEKKLLDLFENESLLFYTWYPKLDKIYDVEEEKESVSLYEDIIKENPNFDNSQPIYIIALTNYEKEIGRRIESAYIQGTNISIIVFVGGWLHNDFQYADISIPLQFSSDDDAKMYALEYAQKTIIKIKPNGCVIFINTKQQYQQ
jgi:hypothetical protein